MCGIVGARDDWLRRRRRSPEASVATAVAALAWRGEDDRAVRRASGWWLGCARLAISAGEGQPIRAPAANTTAVLNGAITNARDLWRQLSPGAERQAPLPNDAALPSLAVSQRRTDLLDGLRGHHAYAVVDERTDEVYLGQDRYGERPLWCVRAKIDGRWQLAAFSSTLTALRCLGVHVRASQGAVAQWFRYGWSEGQEFAVGDDVIVCELPARGAAYVARPTSRDWVERVYEPRPTTAQQDARGDAGALPELLAESVTRCLDTPSAAGLSLSGGVDSSCLALTLGAIGQEIPAYQFSAAGAPADERRAATAVAAVAGLPLRPVDGGVEVLDALPELTRMVGQPLGDPSVLAAHAVAKAARADGVKVLLGGEGADELLLGYRRYRLLQCVPQLPRLPWLARWTRRLRPWSTRAGARLARAFTAPNPVRALLAVTPPAFGLEVLAGALADAPCWQDAERLQPASSARAHAGRDDDLAHYLPRDLLPKLDVALLAAGVEGRCPYLEAGIEPFGADLSALGKRPLRAAFAARLPSAVKRLPKRGFSLPLNAWFRGELDALDVLAEERARGRPHLRPGGLARAVDQHRARRSDLGHGLYLLYAYELHLRDEEQRRGAG